MKLFGKEILVREKACAVDGGVGESVKPTVRLYAKVTNACNARCRFCSNGNHSERIVFNVMKFFEIVRTIKRSRFNLQRVCITGGEPSCAENTVMDILRGMESNDLRDVPLFLSTNGISDSARRLMRHPRLDCVTMSLHHYDYGRMAEIYGVRDRIEEFSNLGIAPRKFTASCNLMRGCIDSSGEAKRMMDFALQIGCGELGFVSLMEKNAFCKEAFVDIDDLRIGDVEHVISVSRHASPMGCRCRNFLYASGNRTLSVYLRDAGNFDNSESVLLFDGQYLRQGFGSENIIY